MTLCVFVCMHPVASGHLDSIKSDARFHGPAGNLSLSFTVMTCITKQQKSYILFDTSWSNSVVLLTCICIQIHPCMLTQDSEMMLRESLDLSDLQMHNRMHICI